MVQPSVGNMQLQLLGGAIDGVTDGLRWSACEHHWLQVPAAALPTSLCTECEQMVGKHAE